MAWLLCLKVLSGFGGPEWGSVLGLLLLTAAEHTDCQTTIHGWLDFLFLTICLTRKENCSCSCAPCMQLPVLISFC